MEVIDYDIQTDRGQQRTAPLDWAGDRTRCYDGGCGIIHSGGETSGLGEIGSCQMENQIKEKGLTKALSFIFRTQTTENRVTLVS